jgi:hypothetical protein
MLCCYKHKLFLIFDSGHNHVSFGFHYDAYAMFGDNCDMVNCYDDLRLRSNTVWIVFNVILFYIHPNRE